VYGLPITNRVKGKVYPVHTTKAYRGIAPHILNFDNTQSCVFSFTLWPLDPRE